MINIQNIDDNEFFEWSIVRYLNPGDHHRHNLQKLIKNLPKSLILKTKFPEKFRDIHEIKKRKKKSIGINAFGYDNKEKTSNLRIKKCEEKHCNVLFIVEERKRH